MVSDILRAEQKSRARAWCMALLALVTAINSTLGLDGPADNAATLRGGMWLVTIALCLAVLSTNGGLMLNKGMRAMMFDERTLANRARAFSAGFLATMLAAALLYAVSWSTPIEVRAAIRLVTGLGLAAALARFAMLELQG